MIKKETIYILIFLLFLPAIAYSDRKIDSLESELIKSQGAERVDLLIKLSVRLEYMTRNKIETRQSAKKCIKYADEAIKLSKRLKSDSLILISLITRGDCYVEGKMIFLPYYLEGLYYLKQIKIPDPSILHKIYFYIQNHHKISGRKDSSEYYNRQWVKYLEMQRNIAGISYSYFLRGHKELERREDINSADSLLELSLFKLKETKNDSLITDLIFTSTLFYQKYNFSQKGKKLLEREYSYFNRLNNKKYMQKYYYFMGLMHFGLNDHYNGIRYTEKSLSIGNSLDINISREYIVYAYEMLAGSYTKLELMEEAKTSYESSIKYAKDLNNPQLYTKLMMNYGLLYSEKGVDSSNKALEIFESIRDDYEKYWAPNDSVQDFYLTTFLYNLGFLYFEFRNIDSLASIIKRFELIKPNLEDTQNFINVNFIKMLYEYLRGNYLEALDKLEVVAEKIADIEERIDDRIQILNFRHKILFKLGKYVEAYDAYKLYHKFQDSVKTNQKIFEVSQLKTNVKQERAIHEQKMKNNDLERKEKQNSIIIAMMIIAAVFLLIFTIIVLRERAKSEKLLLNILPEKIAKRLKTKEKYIAEKYNNASIMFIDIAQFTKMSSGIAPERLVEILNDIFTIFDNLSEKHGLEKIKTIGDCYLAVAGIPVPRIDHVTAAADMALDVIKMTDNYITDEGITISFRIGIDCGPVVAGIIGQKKFIYDLWGDTVNVASRMEDFGVIGEVQVSDRFKKSIESIPSFSKNKYNFIDRGLIEIKGKGKMHAWFLRSNS